MAFDYEPIADLALELIQEFGRDATLIRLSRTATDVSKPWRASLDPRATPDDSEDVKVVQVEPGNDLGVLGSTINVPELIARNVRIFIVASKDNPAKNLETFDEVLDGGVYYKCNIINTLQPGDTKLLHFFEVANVGT